MTGDDTLLRVANIVRRVFRSPDAVVAADTRPDDVEGWDSLSHGLVLMAVEREFAIRFDRAQVLIVENLDGLSVGDLVRAVDARLAVKRSA